MKRVINFSTHRYTFNICFDKTELKNKLNNSWNFPLLTYLRRYQHKANLKTLELLFFDALNRKDIKKKIMLLLRNMYDNGIINVA